MPGDEAALLPDEAPAFSGSIETVRRASGAARLVARDLLSRLGYHNCAIKRGPSGAPNWPAGIVGSLAHDGDYAVAAICRSGDFAGLGVDVEPAEPLPSELIELVATPEERVHFAEDEFAGRMLFVAKEAVYKAVYPIDRMFLDHHDVKIDLKRRKAVVRNGRVAHLRFCVSTHIAALALISKKH